MRAASLFAVISSAVLAIPAVLAVSSDDVMNDIQNVLIPRTQALTADAQSLSLADFVEYPIKQGKLADIYIALVSITKIFVDYTAALDSTTPFTDTTAAREITQVFINLDSDSSDFADAMTNAVNDLASVLNTVSNVGATGESIKSALQDYTSEFDGYAGAVNSATSMAGSTAIRDNQASFDKAASKAVVAFSGITSGLFR